MNTNFNETELFYSFIFLSSIPKRLHFSKTEAKILAFKDVGYNSAEIA